MSQAGEKELVGVKFKAADGIKLFRIPQKIWRKQRKGEKDAVSSVSKFQGKLCHLFLHDETTGNTAKTHKTVTRDGFIILLLDNAC